MEKQLAGIQRACGHLVEEDMTTWPTQTPRNNMMIWLASQPCEACFDSRRED